MEAVSIAKNEYGQACSQVYIPIETRLNYITFLSVKMRNSILIFTFIEMETDLRCFPVNYASKLPGKMR